MDSGRVMQAYLRWKFTVLLLALIIQFMTRLVSIELELPPEIVELSGICLFLPAVLAMFAEPRPRQWALILGVLATGCVATAACDRDHPLSAIHLLAHAATALFVVFVVIAILREMFRDLAVSVDTLVGAFCGYMLIGVGFTEVYCALQILNPASLQFGDPALSTGIAAENRWQISQYFSFATLTTLGYGDVSPASPVARSLSILEAMCGQFYLAVLVAGLVGVRCTQWTGVRPLAKPPDSAV